MTYPTTTLRDLPRKVRGTWFEDGLAELVVGAGFLLYAALLALTAFSPAPVATGLRIVGTFYPLLLALGGRWLIVRLKGRIAFPRIGYVRFPLVGRVRRTLFALFAGLAAVALMMFVLSRGATWAYLTLLSLSLAGLYAMIGYTQALPRGYLYAALALVAGLLTAALPEAWQEFGYAGGLYLILLGMAQMVGGAWSLGHFLHRYPKALEEADEAR